MDQTRGYRVMTGSTLVIIGLSLLLAGCVDDDAVQRRTIAKVCKDGTLVYQRANGSYYIGGPGGGDVKSLEVCQ